MPPLEGESAKQFLCIYTHGNTFQLFKWVKTEDLRNFEIKSKGSYYGVNHLSVEAWVRKLLMFMCKSVGFTFHSFVITALNSASGTYHKSLTPVDIFKLMCFSITLHLRLL